MQMIKKSLIGLVVVLVILLFVFKVGPQIYYSSSLPSETSVSASDNLSNEFKDWNLSNNLAIVKDTQLPKGAFKCSVCYPNSTDSSQCKQRVVSFVAKNLLGNQGPDKALNWHLKSYLLGNVLVEEYSEMTLYKLYLTFANQRMNTSNIDETCKVKFNKGCAELSPEEEIKLELLFRAGSLNTELSSDLFQRILSFCVKK